jgi:antitoxin component of MazEF toxin-antitoxin module
MTMLKLMRIGDSVGVRLPKELLAKLGASEGAFICATDRTDGIRLTPADPKFLSRLQVTHRVSRVRRAVLTDLAK